MPRESSARAIDPAHAAMHSPIKERATAFHQIFPCSSYGQLIVRHLAFVPSPHNMRTAIDKSNVAGDVACTVTYQKGRHRADIIGDERRIVER